MEGLVVESTSNWYWLPEGYIYPKAVRAVRDLLRKRAHLVRQHTANVLSVQNIMARNTGARFSVKRIQELTKQELTILLAEETQVLAVTRSLVVLDLISNACSGIAVRLPRASGAVRVRTNCSGSASRPTTGGSCYRWNQKHYAKNCQLRNLQRETIPVHGTSQADSSTFDLPLDGLSWMDEIAEHDYDVDLVDLRGYGGSTRPPEI